MSVEARVTGLAPVVSGLSGLASDVDDLDLSPVAERAAEVISAATPRRSGRLAAGNRSVVSRNRAVVTNAVPYAGPRNYGWPARGIEASGFMQAADDQADDVAATQLATEITTAIRRRNLT